MYLFIAIFLSLNLFSSLYFIRANKSGFSFNKTLIRWFAVLNGVGILMAFLCLFGSADEKVMAYLAGGWIIFSSVAYYLVVFLDSENNNSFLEYEKKSLPNPMFLSLIAISIIPALFLCLSVLLVGYAAIDDGPYKLYMTYGSAITVLVASILVSELSFRKRVSRSLIG